jgi:hypothetical protein
MSNVETIEAIPDPGRTMEGLRDTGYDFKTAIADLVDNSIAAGADNVDIRINMDFRGDVRVSIADDGEGMDREGLKLAMQYGSPKRSDPASLGKYGLGLKTASTAFCKRLSVISRDDGSEPAVMATWDLDAVIEAKKWILHVSDEPDAEGLKHLNLLTAGPGTAVVWTKVDRLLHVYQDPRGGHAANGLKKHKQQLVDHLAAVYQRFLDPNDKRARNVSIKVDGVPVKAWDPFQKSLSELLVQDTVKVEGTDAEFTVRAYILPRREDFPNDDLAKAAKLSSDRQGIYIYRQDRLIHDADWLGMYQKEPHSTLLRVEFSFDHRLDDAFHLDIKKSQIILNDDLWTWLKDQFLPAPRREANRRYRLGLKKDIGKAANGAHDASNRNIGNKEAEVGGPEVNVTNPGTGDVTVINAKGKFNLKLRVSSAAKPGEIFIQPAEDVEDGMLFEPAIVEMHKAVRINTNHPYYHKVYVPNFRQSVIMQGMDSLLWALSVAELSSTTDKTAESFKDMRFEVSRILRKLVEGLPEPDVSNEADVA